MGAANIGKSGAVHAVATLGRPLKTNSDLGTYLAIEPMKRLKAWSRGHLAYRLLTCEYRRNPEEWKRVHQYGKRNLAETVFGMMKVRFGGGLSSRGHREQTRELLIKAVLFNNERLNYLECAVE